MDYRKPIVLLKTRVNFDPNNPNHMRDYATFLKTKNWVNGCGYYLEDPYEDIPTMINAKITSHALQAYM